MENDLLTLFQCAADNDAEVRTNEFKKDLCMCMRKETDKRDVDIYGERQTKEMEIRMKRD